MRPLTVPLDEIAPGNDDVGVQAKSLGALIHAGMPVPPGFVVVADAWSAFVDAAGLSPLFEELKSIAGASADDGRLLVVAADIRARILSTPLPLAIELGVHDALSRIGTDPVTLRVDGDVQMNVDAGDLGEALKRSWASAWSEPAVMTRAKRGFDPHAVKVAVVVEQSVQADIEGELFTVDPEDGEDHLVIDANVRRGAASHVVVDKRTLAVVPGSARAPGGGAAATAVPSDALRALAKLAVDVERLLKAPQDIAWALAGGKIVLLEARTIPGRKIASASNDDDDAANRALGRVTAALFHELAPRRPYPIDTSGYGRALLEGIGAELCAPFGIKLPAVNDLFIEDAGVVVGIAKPPWRPTLRVLWRPSLSLWKHRGADPSEVGVDDVVTEVKDRVRRIAAQDLARLSNEELFAYLGDADLLAPRVARARKKYFPRALKDTAVLWMLLSSVGQGHRMPDLVDDGKSCGAGAVDHGLDQLAALVKEEPDLVRLFDNNSADHIISALAQHAAGRRFLGVFRAFLNEHGHRGTGGLLLASHPSWKNAPEVPLALVQDRLHARPSAPPSSTSRTRADDVADELVRTTRLGKRPLHKTFLKALEGARRLPRLHEDTRDLVGVALPVVHTILLELGKRLTDKQAIDAPAQIFHLTIDEVKAAFAPFADVEFTRTLVGARMKKRAAVEARAPWAEVVRAP